MLIKQRAQRKVKEHRAEVEEPPFNVGYEELQILNNLILKITIMSDSTSTPKKDDTLDIYDKVLQEQVEIAEAEALSLSGLQAGFDEHDTKHYQPAQYTIYQSVRQGIINAFTKY